MVLPIVSNDQKICPRCHQPLSPDIKFCETCGAKIEPAPVCPHCGDHLTPGVKFCETCGKPVGAQPAPPAPIPDPVPVATPPSAEPPAPAPEPVQAGTLGTPMEPTPATVEKSAVKKGSRKLRESAKKTQKNVPAPQDETPPVSLPEPATATPENVSEVTVPEKPAETAPITTTAVLSPLEEKSPPVPPEPVVVPESVPAGKIPAGPEQISQKSPVQAPASGSRTLVIAGVVGLVILAALAFFVLLPMISGQGSGGTGNVLSPTVSPPLPSAAPTGSSGQSPSVLSFEPRPTQMIPVNLVVTYQAERNPITGLVTVTFTGGPGLNGISQTLVTLTKSDGGIETKSFKPKQIGDSVTLQGTLKTDRIEVITNFYNGDTYRVIDRLFEYKKKN